MKTFDNVFDNPKEKLKLDLINLESYLMESLRRKILLEGKPSAFLNDTKAIKVNEYMELIIRNGDKLRLVDANGKYFMVFNHCDLHDLIDLL